jgi:tetratricopeptide (TPR) repeat protein
LTRYLLTGLPTKREYGHVLVVSAAPATGIDTRASDPRELGRQFNVRYVLEGDVLRDGKSNTVNFRLVDTATRSQVWSGRETFQDADVVSGSSVPLRVVATSLRYALIDAEIRRVKVPPIAALSASELVLRAFALGGEDPSLAGLSGAGKLVDEALRLEPDLVPALVLRAALINNEFEVDPSADRNRMTREQDRLTARAVQLDSADPAAWAWRAAALGSVGRWNAALEASAAAIKLDPYEPRWYLLRAGDMILMARLDDALEMANRALALYPGSALATATACEVHVLAGRTEEAIATCERASGHADDWAIHLALAAAYANHGEMAKAAAAKAEVLRIIPGLTIAQLRAKRASDNPEYVTLAETYWYAGLRKAGLPEK